MKSSHRTRVEALIKIAQTTNDDDWRESILLEAYDLVSDGPMTAEALQLDDACDLIMRALEKEPHKIGVRELDDLMKLNGFNSYKRRMSKERLKENGKIDVKRDGYQGSFYVTLHTEVIE